MRVIHHYMCISILLVLIIRLDSLCSEVQFIQDFAGRQLLSGGQGFLLGKLQVCSNYKM